MKNLKKLNRKELKKISGGDLIGNVFSYTDEIIQLLDLAVCNVQCTVNGVVQIKILPCNSTC
ncbi:bacteriocin-like protein [Chryseobacterium sp. JUb7]|uniref:bacteriocin-like protein n=1 Tax=Chryseobacterium sp. JUb7 TaxID=2940599 RepID=UPI002167EAAF|nr:bacteriocin [Chryseobacterium sp. JUb7]MCS3528933.1 bacteriocin-like protein [Chryseobacterium sp. JUb7]